jgi:hypothetical protein
VTEIGLDVLGVVIVATVLLRRGSATASATPARRRSWLGEPGNWLAAVVAACAINQVLFTVYVIRVHAGDASFIARYVPSGWFDLADRNGVIDALARTVPHPSLLAPTVLRVQAFLELPLVVLAYLTVVRWFDHRLYRRLLDPPVMWISCGAYTAAFMLVEAHFWNPYTRDDLIIRVASCLVTALVAGAVLRRVAGRREWSVDSVPAFAAFIAGTVAFGGLVLVVYDTVLLYNLGRVRVDAPIAVLCGTVLLVARLAARRVPGRRPAAYIGVLLDTVGRSFGLFFPCALPIRYMLGFGTGWLAAALALVIAAAALIGAVRASPLPRRALAVALTIAAGLGAVGAIAGLLMPLPYPEARLLIGAALSLALATGVLHRFDVRREPADVRGVEVRTPAR